MMLKAFLYLALLVVLTGCDGGETASDAGKAAFDATQRTDCDTFAAAPEDMDRKADAITFEKMDAQRALDSCRAAIGQFPKSPRLHFQLGRAYERATDFDQAAAEYRQGAEADYTPAQIALARLYTKGHGVAIDDAQAVAWCERAARLGDPYAQYSLGDAHERGNDFNEARAWYKKSVAGLSKAAATGDAVAQNHLASMYAAGLGVSEDYVQAIFWFRKAAEQGEARSQYDLGRMYEMGKGVLKDYDEAMGWYKKAADQGYAYAQSGLGGMYAEGRGVKKDGTQAAAWYKKAADQGNAEGQKRLGDMYQKGNGVSKDYAKAI